LFCTDNALSGIIDLGIELYCIKEFIERNLPPTN